MTGRLARALQQIATDLDALGVSWALVGGLAVGARAEPRTTRDVDVAILVENDAEAERLAFDLGLRGYTVVATVEQKRLGRLATVRLCPPAALNDFVEARVTPLTGARTGRRRCRSRAPRD